MHDLVPQGHVTIQVTFSISITMTARTMILFLFLRFLIMEVNGIRIRCVTFALDRVRQGYVAIQLTFPIATSKLKLPLGGFPQNPKIPHPLKNTQNTQKIKINASNSPHLQIGMCSPRTRSLELTLDCNFSCRYFYYSEF